MIEIPEGLTQNDISTFITSNDISTKLEANDVSQFASTDDVSNLITQKVGIFKITGSTSNKQGYTDNPNSSYADNIGENGFIIGNNHASGKNSFSVGINCYSQGNYSFTANYRTYSYGEDAAAFGAYTRALGKASFASGERTEVNNSNEAGFGAYNDSSKNSAISISTLFSVGNGGNLDKKHNALEIKKNGDVYIPDTDDTASANYYEKPMKRLQDLFILETSVSQLWDSSMSGGGSADLTNYYTKTQIDTSIANNYASKNDISTFVTENDVSIYSTNTYVNSTFAKIRYISQSDYDALATKDPSTLYIIPS